MKDKRKGDWMQTYTGIQFWPLDPYPEEIDVEDIAHALSMLCRYNGHCLFFYSVAEHSVYVSRALPDNLKLAGLLHDSAEAYLSDVPRPIKPFLSNYKPIENKLLMEIAEKFGCLDSIHHPLVKEMDNRVLMDEKIYVMGEPPEEWSIKAKRLNIVIKCWNPKKAKRMFLKEYKRIIKS